MILCSIDVQPDIPGFPRTTAKTDIPRQQQICHTFYASYTLHFTIISPKIQIIFSRLQNQDIKHENNSKRQNQHMKENQFSQHVCTDARQECKDAAPECKNADWEQTLRTSKTKSKYILNVIFYILSQNMFFFKMIIFARQKQSKK